MPYPYVGDMDMSTIQFSKIYMADGKSRVDILQSSGRKFIFSLCSDCQEPYAARYPLDRVNEDATDKTRRGQKILLEEEATRKALESLDEAVIKAAIANATDWFKSKLPLSEEMIRSRYQKAVFEEATEDGSACLKFKVKVEHAKVPTKLHRVLPDGRIVEHKGAVVDLESKGAKLAPILSSFGLWFMGGKDPTRFGVSFQAEELVVTPGEGQVPLSNFSSKRKMEVLPAHKGGDADEEQEEGHWKRVKPGFKSEAEEEEEEGPVAM